MLSAALQFVRVAAEREREPTGGRNSNALLGTAVLAGGVAELVVKVGLAHVHVVGDLGAGELGVARHLLVGVLGGDTTVAFSRDGGATVGNLGWDVPRVSSVLFAA
jgi:hypothetical protein